jgi:hypothetical protein
MCHICEIKEVAETDPNKALVMLGALNLALDVKMVGADISKIDPTTIGEIAMLKKVIVDLAVTLATILEINSIFDDIVDEPNGTIH